ncbi:LuxR C-terminal-related transcriptional regulator [Nocardia sp. CA2R105]|uniref:ATP-binding protein n=1 Tax=Nocardia coffeae TaxID=2873381 RepID=UPI001CA674D0|nr:LuxR C-terminal-related transcriptional regulator [Nocardia coffeae]MBY8862967.1 LuxR C-terminal-related transcriptional regulator [Nocardia coffeae]
MAALAWKGAGNLPAQLDSFIGRRQDMVDLKQAMSSSRLITLVGPGGVGKTRLALQAAAESQRAFKYGAWFVDISAVYEDELLIPTIAEALGLQSRSSRWAPAVLSDQLAGRAMLLVLDNCEYLVHSCAVLVDTLLKACPELKVVATSRQPLEVSGERILRVQPLSVPEPSERVTSVSAVERFDAGRLFVDRAKAAEPRFMVTDENAGAIAELCRRLDGLPLALELAAARVRHLSPQRILERLDERYELLRRDSRATTPRQRSVVSLIAWSYDLCSPEERTLWARLTVFSGSFSVHAAESVCSGDGLSQQNVLDVLARLVDKSIVATQWHAGDVRYRMLETIRDFGREQLVDSAAELTFRRRHRDFFRDVVVESYPVWFSATELQCLSWIRAERDNLRAAVDFSLDDPVDERAAVVLGTALGGEALLTGLLQEGRHWMDRVVKAVREPSVGRATLLWINGRCAAEQGETQAAEQLLGEAVRLAEILNDRHEQAMATTYLGVSRMARGATSEAVDLYDQALELVRDIDDPMARAVTLPRKGVAMYHLGHTAEGMTLCRDAIAISDEHQEQWHNAEALSELANLCWLEQQIGEASSLATEALRINQRFRNARGIVQCIETLAWVAASRNENERAARLLGAADALWRSTDASLPALAAENHDRSAAQARRALGERKYAEAHRAGGESSTSENVAFALREEPSAGDEDARPRGPHLTRREREIMDLLVAGATNREIAAKLVISPRTVEGHVVNLLGKLGFSSRVQVAAWAAEQQARHSHS